jgi:hypothetical protein
LSAVGGEVGCNTSASQRALPGAAVPQTARAALLVAYATRVALGERRAAPDKIKRATRQSIIRFLTIFVIPHTFPSHSIKKQVKRKRVCRAKS